MLDIKNFERINQARLSWAYDPHKDHNKLELLFDDASSVTWQEAGLLMYMLQRSPHIADVCISMSTLHQRVRGVDITPTPTSPLIPGGRIARKDGTAVTILYNGQHIILLIPAPCDAVFHQLKEIFMGKLKSITPEVYYIVLI